MIIALLKKLAIFDNELSYRSGTSVYGSYEYTYIDFYQGCEGSWWRSEQFTRAHRVTRQSMFFREKRDIGSELARKSLNSPDFFTCCSP